MFINKISINVNIKCTNYVYDKNTKSYKIIMEKK